MEGRKCKVCGEEGEFYDGITTRLKNLSTCKACIIERNRGWFRANPDKVRSNNLRQWNKDKGLRRRKNAEWRKNNPDRAAAQSRRWRKNRPHVAYARWTRRQRVQKQATPSWANLFFISEAYDLARKRSSATGFKWHVDHIVPLHSDVVCGLHCEQNLQVIPAQMNMEKSNRVWPGQ